MFDYEDRNNFAEFLANVSGCLYSRGMAKHEVVNEILDYLEERRTELSNEMTHYSYGSTDYRELDAMYDVYDHLITKLGDDYR